MCKNIKYYCVFVTTRKRSLWRLCFYTCLSVILLTGGGGCGGSTQAGTPPWAGTPHWAGTPPGQVQPPGRYTPWAGTAPTPRQVHSPGQVHPPGNACWDTVNKRAERILLESILVSHTNCSVLDISLSYLLAEFEYWFSDVTKFWF